jgi:cytochrome c biogenesis protein CcmG, thiol:disulfide interchange protein DsbE
MVAVVVTFAGLGALMAMGVWRDDPNGQHASAVGRPAPELTQAPLGEFPGVTPGMLASGDVTLVNFWASWCPPCRAEHPRLLDMAGRGIAVVGVNFRDTETEATKYLEEDGNPFVAVAFDPEGRSAADWGVTALPETFIVDGDGTVLFRFAGPLVGSDYDQRFLPQFEAAQAE